MNYLKVYCNLIRKAENRTPPEDYTEKHHTFPVSIYGKNDKIVVLTGREHYIAHELLERIFIKRYGLKDKRTIKMINAVIAMKGNGNYINSYLYEKSRKRFSNSLKNIPKSEEHRKKISEASKKRYENMEERKKASEQMKKYHKNIDTTGKNNSNYNNGCYYELTSPLGEIGYTNKLDVFCKRNNLSRSGFWKVITYKQKKDHKGWSVRKLD